MEDYEFIDSTGDKLIIDYLDTPSGKFSILATCNDGLTYTDILMTQEELPRLIAALQERLAPVGWEAPNPNKGVCVIKESYTQFPYMVYADGYKYDGYRSEIGALACASILMKRNW